MSQAADLQIVMRGDKKEFAPGEPIAGSVRWGLESTPPGGLVVSLNYRTEGRGTTDRAQPAQVDISTAARPGEGDFQFTAPDAPYTFDGTLVSLRWYIQAESDDATAELPITISPWVETVRLKAVK